MTKTTTTCPVCEEPLSVLLFMGVQPEYLVCSPCKTAYPLPGEGRPGEPVAKVIS